MGKNNLFYQVNFDTNSGSKIDRVSVKENQFHNQPTLPRITVHSMGGLSTPYDFSRPVTVDRILYAKRKKNIITEGNLNPI